MTASIWLGLALTLLAGLSAGSCMLPLKYARRWAWENTWLIFNLASLVVLPWTLALLLVNNLGGVYAALSPSQFVAPVLFGAGWGIAQVLFGLTITRLGVALGYAIIVGLGALLGSLVPLVVNNRAVLSTSKAAVIAAGLLLMIIGISLCAWAGKRRESGAPAAPGAGYALALSLAILCGLMAPMLNYAFAFGQQIASEAVRQGTSPQAASYAVWPVALLGGLVPNVLYSLYLLRRNGTWKHFRHAWFPDAGFGISMAVLWMGAMAVYGVGSVFLGALGTSLGWALFQIFMVMTANMAGILSGEWKSASPVARYSQYGGLALLALATCVIAAGNA